MGEPCLGLTSWLGLLLLFLRLFVVYLHARRNIADSLQPSPCPLSVPPHPPAQHCSPYHWRSAFKSTRTSSLFPPFQPTPNAYPLPSRWCTQPSSSSAVRPTKKARPLSTATTPLTSARGGLTIPSMQRTNHPRRTSPYVCAFDDL